MRNVYLGERGAEGCGAGEGSGVTCAERGELVESLCVMARALVRLTLLCCRLSEVDGLATFCQTETGVDLVPVLSARDSPRLPCHQLD